MKHTRKHIYEALRYWRDQLKAIDESESNKTITIEMTSDSLGLNCSISDRSYDGLARKIAQSISHDNETTLKFASKEALLINTSALAQLVNDMCDSSMQQTSTGGVVMAILHDEGEDYNVIFDFFVS